MALSQAFLEWEEKTKQLGKQEGLLEGKQAGLLEGKQQVAVNLIRMGLSNEQIVAATDFSPAQIQQLREELNNEQP